MEDWIMNPLARAAQNLLSGTSAGTKPPKPVTIPAGYTLAFIDADGAAWYARTRERSPGQFVQSLVHEGFLEESLACPFDYRKPTEWSWFDKGELPSNDE